MSSTTARHATALGRATGAALQGFNGQGNNQHIDGAVNKLSKKQAATDAGMSERQRDTAVRVANVPPRILESAVEARRVDRLAVLRLSARRPCRRRILALTY